MKKYLGYAAVIGLAIPVSFAIPTAAQAGHVPETCKFIVNELGGDAELPDERGIPTLVHVDNIGQCSSYLSSVGFGLTSGGARSNVPICKALARMDGAFERLGFQSFGDCVVNFEW